MNRNVPRILAGMLPGLFCAVVALPAYGDAPLRVSIVKGTEGAYYEPAGGLLLVESQPVRLSIRIQSTSTVAVGVRVAAERFYSLELQDESGRTTIVKRKEKADQGGDDKVTQKLAPGEEVVFPLAVNPDEWDGVPDFTAPGKQKFKLRAIYNSLGYGQIYSPTYTLNIQLPPELQPPNAGSAPAPEAAPGVKIIR